MSRLSTWQAVSSNVEIVHGSGAGPDGTLSRTGGICVNCGSTISLPYIKAQGRQAWARSTAARHAGADWEISVLRVPDDAQRRAASIQAPDIDWLDAELSTHSQYMAPPRYGMTRFKDLFSVRQLTTLKRFCCGLDAVQRRAEQDAHAAGLSDDDVSYSDGGKGARAYGEAMRVLLALGIDRLVNRQSTLCIWHANGTKVEQVFGVRLIHDMAVR